MKPMYQNLMKLYHGLDMIRSHYQNGTIINPMQKIPNYLIGPILRAGSINNFNEQLNYEKIINIGEENDPFYIIIFDNPKWSSYVDVVMSPLKYTRNIMVTASSRIFKETDVTKYISDIYYIFEQLVAFDKEMEMSPGVDMVYLIDKPEGEGIPSYDLSITIAYIYLINKLLKKWTGSTSETIIPELVDYIHSIMYTEDPKAKDEIIYILDTILTKSTDDMEEVIKDGYFLQALYS